MQSAHKVLPPKNQGLFRGTAIVSSLTMLSRVLGFVRDLIVARFFGAGWITDAFFVAFRIPNLLRSFVAEGALSSAFVPVFASDVKESHDRAAQSIRSTFSLLLVITLILSAIGILCAEPITRLFAPGFFVDPEKAALCIDLTRILFPYIIFVSIVALINGALNTVGVYGTSALSQVLMNCVLIVGGVVAAWAPPGLGIYILAWSVLLGGVVQVLSHLPALRRAGFTLSVSRNIITPSSRSVVKLMIPAVVGATVYQLTIFLSTVFASLLAPGSVSWLFYADRVTQLPIGVFSVALASVLLPSLSRAAAASDSTAFCQNLTNSLRFTSFVIAPLSIWLWYFAEPVVTLLFERGAFDSSMTYQTAVAIKGLSLGLWATSCHSMLARAFIARRDTVTTTVVGIFSLGISILASVLLMGAPERREGLIAEIVFSLQSIFSTVVPLNDLGHVGLALASSIAAIGSFLMLLFLILIRERTLDLRPFLSATARALACSGGSIGIAEWARHYFPLVHSAPYALFLSGSIAVVAWASFSIILGQREYGELLVRVRKRS